MDNKLAYNLTKALGYTENGGKPDLKNLKAGKSGEMKSIFQYTPDTWKNVSQQVTGNSNLPLTPDNEVEVTQAIVQKKLDSGMTPEQILSTHNAGNGEPNAYTGKFSNGVSSVGTNKYGVQYDVPSYVKKGMNYLKQFQSQSDNTTNETTPQTESQQINQPESQPTQQVTSTPTNSVGLNLIKGLLGK